MSEKKVFTKETLEHISKLALLDLSEEEKNKLAQELGDILQYFQKLDSIDTSNVNPMTHPIEGLKNVFREDVPWKSLTNEEALMNAKHTKDGYFKSGKVIKE
ncbi:MAG: Asp-tRNA(Asn)/Glu-tRNA(Gln) amidotransferase subunit GatC [Candidatus Lokiarchaeota archaeon]|nr:Asp-tRNA(Asn)/Glu-tRNA(Gln) amidotransferase subunit GatC [Candidatus Lokiarchaeota archaeon]